LYYSSNIIKVIKSRILRWAEHVACAGKMTNAHKREQAAPMF
jgi:hypothetical protein